jgi:hypothetical protein
MRKFRATTTMARGKGHSLVGSCVRREVTGHGNNGNGARALFSKPSGDDEGVFSQVEEARDWVLARRAAQKRQRPQTAAMMTQRGPLLETHHDTTPLHDTAASVRCAAPHRATASRRTATPRHYINAGTRAAADCRNDNTTWTLAWNAP